MQTLAKGWLFDVERGPSCLYIRPQPQDLSLIDSPDDDLDDLGSGFCDIICQIMEQHLIFRVVLEIDQIPNVSTQLINELVRLHQRVEENSGIVRLCGLSEETRATLACSEVGRLADLGFANRDEALMAGRAGRPR